jgi:predicted glycosyltransferase
LAKHTWRVLGGTHLPTDSLKRLIESAPSGVIVEPSRSDFRDVLANCAVSVSQGGYNTIMDLFATSVRAVVLPFVGAGETEQDFRAQRLEQHGLVRRLAADKLSPLNLAKAVDEVALAPPSPSVAINISGAERTAELVFNAAAHGRSIELPRKQSE